MAGKGGRRPGAGRRSKAEELGLQALLAEVISDADRKSLFREFRKLALGAKDARVRLAAGELLLAYLYGRPRQTIEQVGPAHLLVIDDGGPADEIEPKPKRTARRKPT